MRTIRKLRLWAEENNEGIQRWMLSLAIFWSLQAVVLEVLARVMTGMENPTSPTLFYLSVMCYFIREQIKP